MHNCSDDVVCYHEDEVTLPQSERSAMSDRRNANRDRLVAGLEKAEKPTPIEFKSQGSYAMRTMTQHNENAYDIDDGVYFEKTDLVGARGAEMTPLQVRQMVRDAVDDGSFTTPPDVHKNCVRVYYKAGYHVDLPAYRRVVTKDFLQNESVHYELASSEWKRSDARDVTVWFDGENQRQSPDVTNGRQLRRMTRLLKKFARSRSSWESQVLSGFGISKLVTECYRPNESREDSALYETMVAIRDRLKLNLVVSHPVTPRDTITTGPEDSKAKFFKDKLSDAIGWLQPLFSSGCTRKEALKCWDDVFYSEYFSERLDVKASSKASALNSGLFVSSNVPASAVEKAGGERYA